MKYIYAVCAFCFVLLVISCSSTRNNFVVHTEPDGSKMIIGEFERDTLFAYYPELEFEYKYYQPDPTILDSIQNINTKVMVEIYLGTWCGDSRREVPHFFKIVDMLQQNPFEEIRLWAVNRDKVIPESGITTQKNLQRVATFIFLESGREVGRIIEKPSGLLESDMLQILKIAGT